MIATNFTINSNTDPRFPHRASSVPQYEQDGAWFNNITSTLISTYYSCPSFPPFSLFFFFLVTFLSQYFHPLPGKPFGTISPHNISDFHPKQCLILLSLGSLHQKPSLQQLLHPKTIPYPHCLACVPRAGCRYLCSKAQPPHENPKWRSRL